MSQRLIRKLAIKLGILIHQVRHVVASETLPQFGNKPRNLNIELPRRIVNPARIFLGDNVRLGPGSLLMAVTEFPFPSMRHPEKEQSTRTFDSKITIGHNVSATAGLQLCAYNKIEIEDDVMFASYINITDGFHGYERGDEPYKYQDIFKIAPIVIKRGSWIGQNVVILPGVTIGQFVIIGANSVVNKDIPDRCIAVGSPAQVIKKWDEMTQEWVSITKFENQSQVLKAFNSSKR